MELSLVQLYHPHKHGITNNNREYGHFLNIMSLENDEFFDEYPNDFQEYMQMAESNHTNYNHPFIRNYQNIIQEKGALQCEIIKKVYIGDCECAIIKTFWLKMLQRKWKNKYHRMMNKRKNPKVLLNRQITGQF